MPEPKVELRDPPGRALIEPKPAGPDLALGIQVDILPDGHMLAGHVGDDAHLLGRRGNEFFAIGASCSHYGGPLAEGLMVEDTVRCPLAPRLFQPPHGRSFTPPGLEPGRVLGS